MRKFLTAAIIVLAASATACAAVSPTVPAATAVTGAPAQATIINPSATPQPILTSTPETPAATETISSEGPTSGPTTDGAATQTITQRDNRRTITLQVGDRFLLNLGDTMDWQLQIDNPAVVSRVPNVLTVKGSQGLFQAHAIGQATLSATGDAPCRKATPPCMLPSFSFQLQIVVGSGSPTPSAEPNTVTTADNGRSITLGVGDRFLLKLGDQYEWSVTVGDPTIVSRVPNILVVKGAQGVYMANKAGETTLSATGTVICPPQQACPMLAVGFQLRIIVR